MVEAANLRVGEGGKIARERKRLSQWVGDAPRPCCDRSTEDERGTNES